MPVNVKLLKKVRKLIAEEPRRLNMEAWGQTGVNEPEAPPCGTVACLAGWTVLAATPKKQWASLFTTNYRQNKYPFMSSGTESLAAELLGVPRNELPFWKTSWGVPEVLAWIDRQIDAASK